MRLAANPSDGGTLPALATLTRPAAQILVTSPKPIYLGLTVLDSPGVAQALAKSQQGVKLSRLRAATPEVIAILQDAKSIETPPLESIYVLSDAVGTNWSADLFCGVLAMLGVRVQR